MDRRNYKCYIVVWYVIHRNSYYVYIINYRERVYIMSMEKYTLRAVSITQNILELQKVNRELVTVRKIVTELEQRKMELISF